MKEVKKYGENGVCMCKDKRERELESKGLKEKAVLEFKENFLERKGVKSFCAERIWQSILSYIHQIYIISSTAVYTIIYKNSDLPFILLNTPSLL